VSKFDGLFDARVGGKGSNKGKAATKGNSKLKPPMAEEHEERPRRGRPSGKRSDPNYVGFTTYIRKDTHRKAKIALLEKAEGVELSELVEELLAEWLKSNPKH
jgi:hypothetical protein